jgi:hypothetical protein
MSGIYPGSPATRSDMIGAVKGGRVGLGMDTLVTASNLLDETRLPGDTK